MILEQSASKADFLFDAKADFLLYGMADKSVIELANALKQGLSPLDIKGLCYIAKRAQRRLYPSSKSPRMFR